MSDPFSEPNFGIQPTEPVIDDSTNPESTNEAEIKESAPVLDNLIWNERNLQIFNSLEQVYRDNPEVIQALTEFKNLGWSKLTQSEREGLAAGIQHNFAQIVETVRSGGKLEAIRQTFNLLIQFGSILSSDLSTGLATEKNFDEHIANRQDVEGDENAREERAYLLNGMERLAEEIGWYGQEENDSLIRSLGFNAKLLIEKQGLPVHRAYGRALELVTFTSIAAIANYDGDRTSPDQRLQNSLGWIQGSLKRLQQDTAEASYLSEERKAEELRDLSEYSTRFHDGYLALMEGRKAYNFVRQTTRTSNKVISEESKAGL